MISQSPTKTIRRVSWRSCVVASVLFVCIESAERAQAADLLDDSFLRGSIVPVGYVRWDGIQIGVTAGVSNMGADFGNSSSSLVSYILRNTTIENEMHPSDWTTLPHVTTNSQQYGAFIGYNWQSDELVLGFDLAYNHMTSMNASASDSIGRQFSTLDGFQNEVTVTAQSSIKLVDYATFRGRAGYAFGQFLPYAVLGAAVGRFNYSTSATVHAVGTPPSGSSASAFDLQQTLTDTKDNAFAAGFVAGLGMDVALLPNVFLRGEWEYIAFAPVNGIRTNLNTGRVGVGLRF